MSGGNAGATKPEDSAEAAASKKRNAFVDMRNVCLAQAWLLRTGLRCMFGMAIAVLTSTVS